jgi:DNA-binding transcriptional LysR family regulator
LSDERSKRYTAFRSRSVRTPQKGSPDSAGGRFRPLNGRERCASIDQACRDAGLQRHIAAEVDTPLDLVETVAHGVGISLLPAAAIRMATGRVIGITTEPTILRQVILVTALDHQPSPAAKALLALMDIDSQPATRRTTER